MLCKKLRALWLTDLDDTLLPPPPQRTVDDLLLVGAFLRELEKRCVLTAPVTFKTEEELLYLSGLMGYELKAFVTEGGCQVFAEGVRLELCRGLEGFSPALDELEGAECDRGLARLSKLDAEKVSGLLGLTLEEARRAVRRRFSEAVVAPDKRCAKAITRLAEGLGLRVVATRRFLHVSDVTKKEGALELVRILRTRLAGPVVASGDGPADAGFMGLADVRILVSSDLSTWFRGLPYKVVQRRIPKALIAEVSRLILLYPPELATP